MPSIPQSLLWISLVVLWLFVLVPMLISKRDAVRRTSDVALATRVLNSATSSRLLKRARDRPPDIAATRTGGRPKAISMDESDYEDHDDDEELPQKSVVVAAAVIEDPEPEYLDVDVIDEASAALPVGESDADEDADEETGELTLDLEESRRERRHRGVRSRDRRIRRRRRKPQQTSTSTSKTPRASRPRRRASYGSRTR